MKLLLLSFMASLLFPFSAYKEGELKEITKPYLGQYECQIATLGDYNLAEHFKSIVLELGENDTFTLTALDKSGKKRVETGKYTYNDKKQTLTFYGENNRVFKRETSLCKGEFCITLPVGNKTVRLVFKQK